ncbi:competence protein ComEA [Bacillus pakistanensis]|uniref:Competence protein ComEA n=1 Tax=Rossellomorea pakistanensis TaxID=992288 RepID=A0ABS2NA71_9BACI|nr:helix-hairpin-helix domain-containing protein [Bacillus pakistanensis]MBM7584750.1 competence protein ComEA [Bacillus pakistanensis]
MKILIEKYKPILIVSILTLLAGFAYFINRSSEDTSAKVDAPPIIEEEVKKEINTEKEVNENTEIYVDVKGEVKNPGIYKARAGERVNDIIIRAGDFTENAQPLQVNLAQTITDEMVIYVPKIGESDSTAPIFETQGNGQSTQKIDINSAEEAELDALPGIGPSKAAAIIEYRETNGPFKSVEDLKEVSGIGEQTLLKLKEEIIAN